MQKVHTITPALKNDPYKFTELRSQINLFHSFPPVLIARGISTLVVQTYVESFSTSAMALIGGLTLMPQRIQLPDSYGLDKSLRSKMPTYSRPNFTYEPRFPILSVEAAANGPANDIPFKDMVSWREEELDLLEDPGLLDEMKIYDSIRSWLDRVGI